MSTRNPATVVFGATGYLGTLATATLLAEEPCRLILPVRGGRSREQVLRPILAECEAMGRRIGSADLDRVEVTELPDTAQIPRLAGRFRDLGVDRIVHCAGSVHYFDRTQLHAGNVVLTDSIAQLAVRSLDAKRALYDLSPRRSARRLPPVRSRVQARTTAGPCSRVRPHKDYTRSKREAEFIVARSGVPFAIVRPSVVVGDSRDGRYSGKRYGVYQLWHAADRLMGGRYPSVIYTVAPPSRLHILHQDAFQAGFLACYRHLPAGRFVNLVSRDEGLPTLRDLCTTSGSDACKAESASYGYYDTLEEVPLDEMDRLQHLWLEFSGVNLQIAAHPWSFETGNLDDLASHGLKIAHATVQTLAVCQEHFIAATRRLQELRRDSRADREAARTLDSPPHLAGAPSGDGAIEVLPNERVGVP